MQIETKYDNQLVSIKELNWLPWVGSNFTDSNIFLLGDSFYDDGDDWLEDKYAARNFINNQGLNSQKPEFAKRRFLEVVEMIVLNKPSTTYDERIRFWNSVGYCNLAQTPMSHSRGIPSDEDFDNGWLALLQVVEIIKPKFIIKLGKRGIGRLGYLLHTQNTGWTYEPQEFYSKPPIINLSKNNFNLKILGVNHPTGSYGFKPPKWASTIHDTEPELISNFAKSVIV